MICKLILDLNQDKLPTPTNILTSSEKSTKSSSNAATCSQIMNINPSSNSLPDRSIEIVTSTSSNICSAIKTTGLPMRAPTGNCATTGDDVEKESAADSLDDIPTLADLAKQSPKVKTINFKSTEYSM